LNIGNLNSIYNALDKINGNTIITSEIKLIKDSDLIIIPGNGSFKEAMKNLKINKADDFLREIFLEKKKRVMGICIGMQIFLNSSNEDGEEKGLGIIAGEVKKINNKKKLENFFLPHIGWNNVKIIKKNIYLKDIDDNSDFYFLNSYGCKVLEHEAVIGTTNYSDDMVSIVNKNNFFGVQFHPEKSLNNGIKIIKNWIKN